MLSHNGKANHKKELANMYEENVASVQADMSNPSDAIVMVAAMAKIVVIDMERKMLTALVSEKKASLFIIPNTAIEAAKAITAAQSISKRNTFLFRHDVIAFSLFSWFPL